MIDPALRRRLVDEARCLHRRLWPDLGAVRDTRSCLFLAVCLQGVIARRAGVRTMLQAGTAQWPFRRPQDDDGVSATHYSYHWQGLRDPLTHAMVEAGRLPELHVWLAHRDPDTIIDPTSGTWPERAAEGGREWLTPRPPDFLWHTVEEMGDLAESDFDLGITYAPDPAACEIADDLASREIYPRVFEVFGSTTSQTGEEA